jgi:hypothetical protein
MSEGQSWCSVASSVQHRQEAEVAAAEERERAAVETAATAARAARVAMVELAAARAEVEAAAVVVELKALRASSTGSSVSADDDRDNELKLAREAAREQAVQWAATHPQGCRGSSPDERGRAGGALGGGTCGGRVPDGGGSPDRRGCAGGWVDGDRGLYRRCALPPRTGTMVTMGSRPLSGMSVPTVGGLPSRRPTTSSGSR